METLEDRRTDRMSSLDSAVHLPPAQHEETVTLDRDFTLQKDARQHPSSQQESTETRERDFAVPPPQQLSAQERLDLVSLWRLNRDFESEFTIGGRVVQHDCRPRASNALQTQPNADSVSL